MKSPGCGPTKRNWASVPGRSISAAVTMQILSFELRVRDIHTRMPFRYGIASMTQVPHVVVSLQTEIDGQVATGRAAESLVPKWFTKVAETPFRQDLQDMLQVIHGALGHAMAAGIQPDLFVLWTVMYEAQNAGAVSPRWPSLLRNLGTSLVERALVDAACRARGQTLAQILRQDAFGYRGAYFHPALADLSPAQVLPPRPLTALRIRHTVGLGDPLRESDIAPADRVPDGLPQSLEAVIRRYGVRYLKIKIGGDVDTDMARMRAIAGVLQEHSGRFPFTLDGNEQYRSFADFRDFWAALAQDEALAGFLQDLLFIEQPLHRDVATQPEATRALRSWTHHPPVIVDESDGDIQGLARAWDCGYQGTSHKNCKGIFKSIANLCHLHRWHAEDPGRIGVLSGEDLTNVGPIALLQDLAVLASLGIPHAERNGHHYFAGLSMHAPPVQETVMTQHPDLYRWRQVGAVHCPAVHIEDGRVQIGSTVQAPFGYGPALDLTGFQGLADWDDRLYA